MARIRGWFHHFLTIFETVLHPKVMKWFKTEIKKKHFHNLISLMYNNQKPFIKKSWQFWHHNGEDIWSWPIWFIWLHWKSPVKYFCNGWQSLCSKVDLWIGWSPNQGAEHAWRSFAFPHGVRSKNLQATKNFSFIYAYKKNISDQEEEKLPFWMTMLMQRLKGWRMATAMRSMEIAPYQSGTTCQTSLCKKP